MNDSDMHWQGWYDRHGPALLLFARQLTDTLAQAEDAMHDGFIRFWKRREQVDDPLAYLYRSVRSAALDRHRADSRREQRERDRASTPSGEQPAPWQHAAKDEEQVCLRASLAALSEAQRELVVMKIWGGLTFAQIAEATGLPKSTAAARYAVALSALKQTMAIEEHTG